LVFPFVTKALAKGVFGFPVRYSSFVMTAAGMRLRLIKSFSEESFWFSRSLLVFRDQMVGGTGIEPVAPAV
jgi:hypothetical protein